MLELIHLMSTSLQLSRPGAIFMLDMEFILVFSDERITGHCNSHRSEGASFKHFKILFYSYLI